MDWFEKLTGFKESDYASTKSLLQVKDGYLHSKVNGKSYAVGSFGIPSLKEIRYAASKVPTGVARVSVVQGDVREMHSMPEYNNALFQVASQFNMLEMTGPNITPEKGVTRYEDDYTQGPACAISAGAATIYRNYFARVHGQAGQTAKRQLNGIAELGHRLASELGRPPPYLWNVQNGYVLGNQPGMSEVARYLDGAEESTVDSLRCTLRVGTHFDVEVTDASEPRQFVSQVFCSAIPIAYSSVSKASQEALAKLVLEAAYEATLLAAVVGGKRIVLLTLLGGGAFGNDYDWIYSAVRRAIGVVACFDLDIRIVSYEAPTEALLQVAKDFN